MVDIDVPKNGIVARKLQILHFFLPKRTHGRWDDISINRHSRDHAGFIVGTIRYDKHCARKLLFLDVPIIDYLGATFTMINSDLMRPSAIIQALSMHTNFLSFLRNAKGEMDFFLLVGVPNDWAKMH